MSAAAAKILASDPGSNVSVNALGRMLPSARREATASTSPVAGSSITTSPPSASMLSIASSSARCAISCSSASRVSTTSLPAMGSAMTRAGDSYSRPSRSLSTTAAPGVAAVHGAIDVAGCESQLPRDRGHVPDGIAQLIGRDAEVISLLRQRDRRAVPVIQRTAARVELHALGALGRRGGRIPMSLDELHLSRAHHQCEQRDREADLHNLEPDEWLGHQRGGALGAGAGIRI